MKQHITGSGTAASGRVERCSEERITSPLQDGPAVLIIDDDSCTCEIFNCALQLAGYRVETASSGADGIAIAKSGTFGLLLVDLRLPDMSGTEVVRAVRAAIGEVRFVLVSAFLTTRITVEAMKLGAVDVIEKPLTADVLLAIVGSAFRQSHGPRLADQSSDTRRAPTTGAARWLSAVTRPRSAAERWAIYVLKACEADGDLKTLEDWATFVGVSYSTLCESCRLLGIQPHDARDLVRLLRAVMKARDERCHPAVLLDVSDRRTLKSLLERAGLTDDLQAGSISVEQLLRCQRFVTGANEGLNVLQSFLGYAFRR